MKWRLYYVQFCSHGLAYSQHRVYRPILEYRGRLVKAVARKIHVATGTLEVQAGNDGNYRTNCWISFLRAFRSIVFTQTAFMVSNYFYIWYSDNHQCAWN